MAEFSKVSLVHLLLEHVVGLGAPVVVGRDMFRRTGHNDREATQAGEYQEFGFHDLDFYFLEHSSIEVTSFPSKSNEASLKQSSESFGDVGV